jgi:uncharacterized membrane protein
MRDPKPASPEIRLERTISVLLRTGVSISAAIVLAGGIYYLFKYGLHMPEYRVFRGEPDRLKSIAGICRSVFQFSARGIIEFGLLVLIATPIARVAFSLVSFARERDRFFMIVTLIVLVILLFNLFGSYV